MNLPLLAVFVYSNVCRKVFSSNVLLLGSYNIDTSPMYVSFNCLWLRILNFGKRYSFVYEHVCVDQWLTFESTIIKIDSFKICSYYKVLCHNEAAT